MDMGHFTPNGTKLLRLGHDPTKNLIRIRQVVGMHKIW